MPRPITNNKRAIGTTLSATPSPQPEDAPSLSASAFSLTASSLQDVAALRQAINCEAAPVPTNSPADRDLDTESVGGLSVDEMEESHILRRDILHDREDAFRAAVAPMADCTAEETGPVSQQEEEDDEDSIPTRAASVEDYSTIDPQGADAEKQPASDKAFDVPAAIVVADGYLEDDWDRPTGQTDFWYDDQPFYDQWEATDQMPDLLASHAPVQHQDYLESQYYVDEEEEEEEGMQRQGTEPHVSPAFAASSSSSYAAMVAESLRVAQLHYDLYYQEHAPLPQDELSYNPDCNCEKCVEAAIERQRYLMEARWGNHPALQHQQQQCDDHHCHHGCEDHACSSCDCHHHDAVEEYQPQPRPMQLHTHHEPMPPVAGGGAFEQPQMEQVPCKPVYTAEGKPTWARGSRGGNPNSAVACCYFLQKGYCKMGKDCWYSHDADKGTPCHYGAACKSKEHRQFLKNQQVEQQQQMPFVPSAGASQTVVPNIAPSVPAGNQHAPRAPALLVPSPLPCACCGATDTVMTQDFPVYSGNQRSIAVRAHCTKCLNTYSL